VGIALAGALSVAAFVLSDASLNIRQNIQEQRFALEELLRQPQPPPIAASAPAIATPTPFEPEVPLPNAPPAMRGTLTGVAQLESTPEMRVASATSTQSSIAGTRSERARVVTPRNAARAPIVIPSDAQGEYFVLAHEASRTTRTLVIQRVGPSGVTYSRLLFDCKTHRFKYLGGGDTLAALDTPAPPRPMGLLFKGSISDYWWHHACRASQRPRR
jgi:hypothetical protein